MASSRTPQQPDPRATAAAIAQPISLDPTESMEEQEHAELTTFQCRDGYVYRIPPASTNGHRAELWRVDDWDAEVAVAVVSRQEECWVRLLDKDSGELFAECPIPKSQPLVTVVEPVVDSSRYYVLRIEDRSSRRHAFIGFGFRERTDASDFNAALDDHLQYLRRKKSADAMRRRYSQARLARANGESSDDGRSSDRGNDCEEGDVHSTMDLALKPGETITVALPWASTGGNKTPPSQRMAALALQARANFVSPSPLKIGRIGSGIGGHGLLPPPPSQRPTISPRVSSTSEAPSVSTFTLSLPESASHAAPAGIERTDGEEKHRTLFRPFEDSCSVAGGGPSPVRDGISSMRASMVRDRERDESASMAALSFKSVGSGGSSLVMPSSCPSETDSDMGPAEAAAAATEEEPYASAVSTVKSSDRYGVPSSNTNNQNFEPNNADVATADMSGDAVVEAEGGEAGDWGDFVAS